MPKRVTMEKDGRSALDAFLWGEVLLFGLLGAALALFVAHPSLRPSYGGDEARLVLQTVVMLVLLVGGLGLVAKSLRHH